MKILTVYNTCGIKRDNLEAYKKSLSSILSQIGVDQTVVVSSCMNSKFCLYALKEHFGNKIEIVFFSEPYIVNVTFNKTVQIMNEKYGSFDGYLYIDSGVVLNQVDAISQAVNRFETNIYSMVGLQVDIDAGFQFMGKNFSCDSSKPQITEEDFLMPVGIANNLHIQIFSNDIYESFNKKLIPDVFAAYCTESTFPFLNAAVGKRWIMVKDVFCSHAHSIDGASSSQSHISKVHGNSWNNLLFNRNALDFINDPEAIESGLGYEECSGIMMHNPLAYDENGNNLHRDTITKVINKYFYCNETELDYNKISYTYFK